MEMAAAERADWEARWREGRIGFHLREVNPHLVRFADVLLAGQPRRVLVPLAGKSVDVAWLAERVPEVTAVELSRLAVDAFFAEHALVPSVEERDGFRVHTAGPVTFHEGDLFALRLPEPVDAVYDRAALIALPPARRPEYAQHVLAHLRPGGAVLLITIEHPGDQTAGPPYSVPEAEVRALFAGAEVTTLADVEPLEDPLRRRGTAGVRERVYRVGKASAATV